MKPVKMHPASQFTVNAQQPTAIDFKLLVNNGVIAEVTVLREFSKDKISRREINEASVKGVLFSGEENIEKPAIALIPGSAGVRSLEAQAQLLAGHGYTVFIVAYSNFQNCPKEIYNIPLENFANALQWLAKQDSVNAENIVAWGVSKGAEALLAAAAHFDLPVKGLVLASPSSCVWQGLGKGKPQQKSSWSLNGEALPYVRYCASKMRNQVLFRMLIRKFKFNKFVARAAAIRFVAAYNKALNNDAQFYQAKIPVENVNMPVLMMAGQSDALWPSVRMAKQILQAKKNNQNWQLLEYKDAGHHIQFPYFPTTISWFTFPKLVMGFGGKAFANAQANIQSWQAVFEFMENIDLSESH